MKKFITIQLVMLALLFGCNPDSNVNSPENTVSGKQLKLIQMPVPQGLSLETIYTESKYIDGANGGYFIKQFNYQGTNNSSVTVTSVLIFPSGAFSGGKTITKTFNTETASLEFGPAMQFNIPVKYTLRISGIDLSRC